MRDFQKVTQVTELYEEIIFPKFYEFTKLYYGDLREQKAKKEEWQANEPSKILARVVDTFWARIFDNAIKFYVSPSSEDEMDVKKAGLVEAILTRAIQVSKLKKKIHMSSRDALLVGEGYGRIRWVEKKEKVEYLTPSGKREYYVTDISYPDYVYISPYNIFVDPVAPDFYSARYIIYRRVMTEEEIINEYKWLGVEPNWAEIKNNSQYVIREDWLLKKIESFYNNSRTDLITINQELSFDKSTQYEVVEYWTDKELSVAINGNWVYEGINPYPLKKKPFVQITYIQEPGTVRGIGLGHQIGHLDKIGTAVLNAFLDDMLLKILPILKRRRGASAIRGNKDIKLKPGKVVDLDDINDLMAMELGRLNFDLQALLQFLLSEAMMIAGVNDLVMGGPLMKVDRSATASTGRIEAFKARTLTFFDSINSALSQIAEMWLAMIIAYNKGGDFSFKVFNDEDKTTTYYKIKLNEIEGQFDIIFDTQALKSALRDLQTQKIINFMQIASQLAVDPITQEPLINFKKLLTNLANLMDLPDIVIKKATAEFQNKKNEKAQVEEQGVQEESTKQGVQEGNNEIINAVAEAAKQAGVVEDNAKAQEQEELPEDVKLAKDLLNNALNPNA